MENTVHGANRCRQEGLLNMLSQLAPCYSIALLGLWFGRPSENTVGVLLSISAR